MYRTYSISRRIIIAIPKLIFQFVIIIEKTTDVQEDEVKENVVSNLCSQYIFQIS